MEAPVRLSPVNKFLMEAGNASSTTTATITIPKKTFSVVLGMIIRRIIPCFLKVFVFFGTFINHSLF